jgi:membrane-associated progesterone receptor component
MDYYLLAVLLIPLGAMAAFLIRATRSEDAPPKKPGSGSAPTVVSGGQSRPTLRGYTLEELKSHAGQDKSVPLLLACCGVVFDVSERRDLYGSVGQGYNVFCGRDASRALAKMDLNDPELLTDDVEGLTGGEVNTLHEWLAKYRQQYDVVGWVIDSKSAHLDPANKKKNEGRV